MPKATPQRPWNQWYGKQRWRDRARLQLRTQPLCVYCERIGLITPAQVADHVVPHKGDQMKFWFGELQSLCIEHHNRAKQQLEVNGVITDMELKGFQKGIGPDGFPIDEAHPFNRQGK